MRSVQVAAWLLVVGLSGLLQACGVESDVAPSEVVGEAKEGLGYEDPQPAPGGLPPGGSEPGGPGNGWSGGWANDPQYAPYTSPSGTDPNRAAREAQQRAYEREHGENHNYRGPWSGPLGRPYPAAPEKYSEDPIPAPPAPRWLFPPLLSNEKERCEAACWQKNQDDDSYCRKLPSKLAREACWIKSIRDFGACIRECSRKFPYYHTET
jgi:hypothetical protein